MVAVKFAVKFISLRKMRNRIGRLIYKAPRYKNYATGLVADGWQHAPKQERDYIIVIPSEQEAPGGCRPALSFIKINILLSAYPPVP